VTAGTQPGSAAAAAAGAVGGLVAGGAPVGAPAARAPEVEAASLAWHAGGAAWRCAQVGGATSVASMAERCGCRRGGCQSCLNSCDFCVIFSCYCCVCCDFILVPIILVSDRRCNLRILYKWGLWTSTNERFSSSKRRHQFSIPNICIRTWTRFTILCNSNKQFHVHQNNRFGVANLQSNIKIN
jgi:hypothetical protein